MTAIITSKFRLSLAESFKEAVDSDAADEKYYIFIGKPDVWDNPSFPADEDLVPHVPEDSPSVERRIWDGIMAMKKVLPNNTSHVVPLWKWQPDMKFVAYSDQDTNLFHHPTPDEIQDAVLDGSYTPASFYVMNQYYQVFVCLNNNGYSVSTTEPQANETTPLTLLSYGDGYVWKYLYTIQTADALKYLTDEWMPVKLLDSDNGTTQWQVQIGAEPGKITTVLVDPLSPGSGYSSFVVTSDVVAGYNSGTATLTGTSVTGPDDNYNGAELWIENSLTAANESRKIIDYDSTTKTFFLESAFNNNPALGDTFSVYPKVLLTGDGSGIRVKAVVDPNIDGTIQYCNVIADPSYSPYTYASATINLPIGAGGQVQPILTPVIPPDGGHGANPVRELGAHYVMVYSEFVYNEGQDSPPGTPDDFPLSNDYRQIGIVRNPLDFSDNILTLSTARAAYTVKVTSAIAGPGSPLGGTFKTDEIITATDGISLSYGSGFLIQVSEIPSTTDLYLYYVQNVLSGFDSLSPGVAIEGTETDATASVDSFILPEVKKHTGDIIYYQNRRPVLRAPNQKESIRIIIEF